MPGHGNSCLQRSAFRSSAEPGRRSIVTSGSTLRVGYLVMRANYYVTLKIYDAQQDLLEAQRNLAGCDYQRTTAPRDRRRDRCPKRLSSSRTKRTFARGVFFLGRDKRNLTSSPCIASQSCVYYAYVLQGCSYGSNSWDEKGSACPVSNAGYRFETLTPLTTASLWLHFQPKILL